MTVYIEYAVLDNFIIDWLLFRYTLLFLGLKVRKGRLFFCALAGTAFAVALPLVVLPGWAELALKGISGALLVLWLAKYPSARKYCAALGVFFLLTVLTGGALTAFFNLFQVNHSAQYCVGLISLGAWLISFGAYRAIRRLYRRREIYRGIVDCEITANGKTVSAKGFVDTGNRLYDGDRAVAICSGAFAASLGVTKEEKYIEVGTVNGREKIPVCKIERLLIYRGDKPNIYENITLGMTERAEFGAYDLLLPAAVAGEETCSNASKTF